MTDNLSPTGVTTEPGIFGEQVLPGVSPQDPTLVPPSSTDVTFSDATPSLKRQRTTGTSSNNRNLNDLAHIELIQIISSLQQQNATLTQLLAKAMEAQAKNVQLSVSSPADVTHIFNEKKNGTSASKWSTAASAPKKVQTTIDPTPAETVGVTSKNKSKKNKKENQQPAKSVPPAEKNKKKIVQKKKYQEGTLAAKEWASRIFKAPEPSHASDSTNIDTPTGFTFIYTYSAKYSKYSEVRERLYLMKVKLNRVYSIQRPAKNVMAILVHNGYVQELRNIFIECGLTVFDDFNPISPDNIGDKKLLEMLPTVEHRTAKAQSLYYNHMLQAMCALKDPKLGLSILRSFNATQNNHYVPEIIISKFIELKPAAIRIKKPVITSVLRGFDSASLFPELQDIDSGSTYVVPEIKCTGDTINASTPKNDENAEDINMDL